MSDQKTIQPDAETEELFKKALQKNKQERKAEETRRNSQGNFTGFEEIEWCGLESKKDIVGRIIGNPIEMRKNSTDPKIVYYSKLVNDKGTGYIEVKWKTNEDGELDDNWILKELYDAVMKKEWVKYPDGHKNDKGYDGEYKYTNEGKSSFIRLSNNQKKDSANQYPPKSNPKKRLLLNWLDRMDNWCKENKHFKLLTSKKNFWKNDDNGKPIYFYKHASGFTIPSDARGVILVGCTQFVINNIVFPEKAGIQLAFSSSNIISGNTITKTNWIESAIYLQASSNNNLSYNSVSSCERGIYLDSDSSNNFMYRNIIEKNTGAGILCAGDSNTFIENHIADNLCGMGLVGASDTIIRKNNFIDNRFHASFFLGYSYKNSNKWQRNFYSPQVPRLIKVLFGAILTPFYYMKYPPDMPPYKKYISRPGFNVDWCPAKVPYDIEV